MSEKKFIRRIFNLMRKDFVPVSKLKEIAREERVGEEDYVRIMSHFYKTGKIQPAKRKDDPEIYYRLTKVPKKRY